MEEEDKKCIKCDSTIELTKDHIIPKWIYKRCNIFGFKKNLGARNKQVMCKVCNFKKGGAIDCSNEIGKIFWTHIRDLINTELAKHE